MKRLVLVLALFVFASSASAQVPRKISYQGVLTDNAGNLVADGNYTFVFRIYNVAVNGSALWTETQNNIPVSKGGFSVLLGNVTSLSLPFDAPYWLGISVNGQSELTPRVQLASSPYAVRADTTLALHLPFSAILSLTGVAPLTIINNAGSVPAILGETNSNAANAYGVRGVSSGSAPTGTSAGVRGENSGNTGAGVWGAHSGSGQGVYGNSNSGYGVYGFSSTGAGMFAYSVSSDGLLGTSASTLPSQNGVHGYLSGAPPGNGSAAVRGDAGSSNSNTVGVWGEHDGGGTGVFGNCATGTGTSGNSSTGTGVWGSAGTGVGLLGTSAAGGTAARLNSGSPTGTALQVQQGEFRVTGAGVGTTTAAFIHQVSAANLLSGSIATQVNQPMCDGDPSAILVVTTRFNPGSAADAHPIAVSYNAGTNHWQIYNPDDGPMAIGYQFNVLVIKTQ